jgi:hypothetical protein
MYGGRGRTRTGTPVSQKQILSLLCLPFHHAAADQYVSLRGDKPKPHSTTQHPDLVFSVQRP